MDRRRSERYELRTGCRLEAAGAKGENNLVENISGEGVLIRWRPDEIAEAPRVGDRIKVEISLPQHPRFGRRAMYLEARVVRVSQDPGDDLLVAAELAKRTIGRHSRELLN